ncbi:hypothetical protein JCM17844_10710 [Iodidimonas gelatinilytica]|uniref:Uncharacterized protein n=1 Tax=Iodidimonas gelatinilytica TaxID=1236966 RepID=A0A5A7N1H5_9PROT|nr:hypothetical protein [Iodidimonas gelatinilytica]GEQ97434.1 hypothetical protein JCM17844_10710 [Iodidimonas gelatinilytica]GER02122.1 hypothetical protein JCM17845_27450 [Iodidimonas gelatinilytica]
MELTSHIWQILRLGRIKAVIQYHDPIEVTQGIDRKTLAVQCHACVSEGLAAANMGRIAE